MIMTFIRDVMSSSPLTVTTGTTLGDLLRLFDHHDFNSFPVLDDRGQLVGVISKLDVLRTLLADATQASEGTTALSSARVADMMTYGWVSVAPEDPIGRAGDLMVETKLHSLPVVQGSHGAPTVMGIVSRGDIVRGLTFQLTEGGGAPAR